ncbi:hypothetical protein AB4562_04780 [Vibrio sp. 10N.222.54.A1]|uniref:hypothetical protein n=1 Tax=unclassified Vibrio TaxID=2614977 RepID=UPI003551548D
MKKSLLTLCTVGLLVSNTAQSKTNPEFAVTQLFECSNGGCTLVCRGASGERTTKIEGIDDGRMTVMKSGVTIYQLDMRSGGDRMLTTSPGNATCNLGNLKSK